MIEGTTNSQPIPADDLTNQASTVINIHGMQCAGCVACLERALTKVAGVTTARASLATNSAEVWHAKSLALDQLLAAAKSVGFDVDIAHENAFHNPFGHYASAADAWFRRAVLGGAVLVLGLLCQLALWTGVSPWATTPAVFFCTVVVYAYVGAPFYRNAIGRLRHFSATMDTLIALGVTVSFCYGLFLMVNGTVPNHIFLEGITILTVVSFGRMIETRARGNASDSIRKLMTLAPQTATVVDAGGARPTCVTDIDIGQQIMVSPGTRVPLDGEVVSGSSVVDESWLTGEAFGVNKQPGDEVLAGSMNGMGSLNVRVRHSADRTTLARVVDLVRKIEVEKPRWERLADLASAWFVRAVLVIAATTFCVWAFMIGNFDFETGVRAAVAVIVVSCPCAFGLATPLALMTARQRGAKHGILIKNAQALEVAAKVSSLLVDRTETVTSGVPSIVRVMSIVAGEPTGEWLRLAAGAEQFSSHPLAQAIVGRAHKDGLRSSTATEARSMPGEGVVALCEGQQVLVGNQKLMERFDVEPIGALSPATSDPRSCVAVAVGGRHVGNIFVDFRVDPIAREIVKRLRMLNVATTMVSGDQTAAEQHVAGVIETDAATSQARPQDILALVQRLQKLGHVVGMVGDGIEDAAALTAADLGIAIGNGADVALESADVVIVNNDFQNIVRVVQLARATRRVIKRNLWWAFGYNLLLIPLAAGLFYPLTSYVAIVWWFGDFMLAPWLAACVMTLSSATVVTSSLSLNYCSLE